MSGYNIYIEINEGRFLIDRTLRISRQAFANLSRVCELISDVKPAYRKNFLHIKRKIRRNEKLQ